MEDLGPLMVDPGAPLEDLALDDIMYPEYMVLCGSWWFTRGIEASAAKRRDVRIDEVRLEASRDLPVSKKDPKAPGEERENPRVHVYGESRKGYLSVPHTGKMGAVPRHGTCRGV